MSLLRPLTAAGTAALGLVLAAVTLSPAHAAEAAAPRAVHVVASDLPAGAAPRRDVVVDGRIVRPGRRPIAVPDAFAVLRVHGGYLAVSTVLSDTGRPRGNRVRFVADSGRRRVLYRLTQQWVVAVATDGRTFVTQRRNRAHAELRSFRVRDGHQVGRALRVGAWPSVPAVSPTRVLVRDHARSPGPARLRWWTPRTGRLTAVPTNRIRPRRPGPSVPHVEASSALRHLVTLPTGHVVDDRRPGRRRWTLGRNEATLVFSPRARRVLTGARGVETSQGGEITHVRTLTVRDARTGRRAVSFTGVFAIDTVQPFAAIAWENEDSFLVEAGDEVLVDSESESYVTNPRLVRCTVSTRRCATAGRNVESWRIRMVVPRSR